jgi:hypothetical protein
MSTCWEVDALMRKASQLPKSHAEGNVVRHQLLVVDHSFASQIMNVRKAAGQGAQLKRRCPVFSICEMVAYTSC